MNLKKVFRVIVNKIKSLKNSEKNNKESFSKKNSEKNNKESFSKCKKYSNAGVIYAPYLPDMFTKTINKGD